MTVAANVHASSDNNDAKSDSLQLTLGHDADIGATFHFIWRNHAFRMLLCEPIAANTVLECTVQNKPIAILNVQ